MDGKIMMVTVPFKKLRRIIQVGDIHIRLLKRHDEYRDVFKTLFKQIQNSDLRETVIVITGDVVHSKVEMSPEMIDLTTEFLKNLSDLAPTILIAGNHDGLIDQNKSRLDALTPIVKNLNHPNLYYLRDSGLYDVADVEFYVWSRIGERSEWVPPSTTNRKKVCLYHGPIYNAETDVGYRITSKHVKIESFDGFDMVLLGDIHKMQVLQEYNPIEHKPIIVYQGSLLQQNHGEKIEGHGYCDWDVSSASFKFKSVENKYGYYTMRIENGVVPNYRDMPENVRLRIFAGSLEQSDIKTLVTEIRATHNVCELSVTNFEGVKKNGKTVDVGVELDVSDINVQNKLITDYLRVAMPNLSPVVVDRVIELNKIANSEISTEDIARKVRWIPISLKFDNLFTYGEGNVIDFTNLKGTIGIFAPNRSGKTSVAEAICFALYDQTPRTNRAANIMNFKKDTCFVEFKFMIDGNVYTVERTGTRNKKGEVKIDVNFYRIDPQGKVTNLNGEQRIYTDKIIKSYVGEYEDFILTTFSSSSAQGLFVDRGQSDRKDLLSQFMGLTIFDLLHKFAKEESREVSGALKQFKSDDFTQDLVDVQDAIEKNLIEKRGEERKLDDVNERLNECTLLIQKEYEKKVPIKIFTNIDLLNAEKLKVQNQLDNFENDLTAMVRAQDELKNKLAQGKEKLETVYNTVEFDYKQFQNVTHELSKARSELKLRSQLRDTYEREFVKLSKHNYDPNCQFCVSNGHATITAMAEAESNLKNTIDGIDALCQVITRLEIEESSFGGIEERYQKFQSGKQWVEKAQRQLIQYGTDILLMDGKRDRLEAQLDEINRKIDEYKNSLDTIEANRIIDAEIKRLESEKTIFKSQFNQHTNVINQLTSKIAVLTQKKTDMLDRIKKASELEVKYEAYEAYLAVVCRDGLPYKMISEVLPSLETAVNNLLGQMAEFSIKFETDGKNVLMKIQYENGETGPLEMASGMEKFICSLAIRVALTTISSLPKSNFLIIDEGLGALDADNLSSIFMLFEVLKTQFEWLFLISHVESVRDVADSLVEIQKNNGFSKININ